MQKDYEIVTTMSLRNSFNSYLDYDTHENFELPYTVQEITDYIKNTSLKVVMSYNVLNRRRLLSFECRNPEMREISEAVLKKIELAPR